MLPALAAKDPTERKSSAFQQANKYDFAKIALLSEAFGVQDLPGKTMLTMRGEDNFMARCIQKAAAKNITSV